MVLGGVRVKMRTWEVMMRSAQSLNDKAELIRGAAERDVLDSLDLAHGGLKLKYRIIKIPNTKS